MYTHYRKNRTISKGQNDTFGLMVLFYFGENPQASIYIVIALLLS